MANASWEQARQEFDRDGFTVVRNLFGDQAKQEWLDAIERYMHEVAPTLDPARVMYEDKDDPDSLLRAEMMQVFDPYFQSLMAEGPCPRFASLMLGCDVVAQHVELMGKGPRVGKPTPPHQDAFYWKLEPKDAMTLWLAIDEVNEENGCIRYVKGSHRGPMRDHAKSGQLGFSQKMMDYGEADERNSVPVCMEPGDVIAHHCMTIHRADANPSDRPRRGMRIIYHGAHVAEDDEQLKAYKAKLYQEWADTGKL